MGQSGNELEAKIIKDVWNRPVVLYVIYEPERSLLWKWHGFETMEIAHSWIAMTAQIVHYVIWDSDFIYEDWDSKLYLRHFVVEEWDVDDNEP